MQREVWLPFVFLCSPKSYLCGLNLPNIYLLDSNYLPYFFDNQENKIKFKFINIHSKNANKILKKEKYGINAWVIKPILNGNVLIVNIFEYKIKLKNKELYFTFLQDAPFQVKFQYIEKNKQWEIF